MICSKLVLLNLIPQTSQSLILPVLDLHDLLHDLLRDFLRIPLLSLRDPHHAARHVHQRVQLEYLGHVIGSRPVVAGVLQVRVEPGEVRYS